MGDPLRTFPIVSPAGLIVAIEIEIVYCSPRPLARLLEKVPTVSSIHRRKPFSGSSDVRLTFQFRERPFVVAEPFGDNSRYWIGPQEAGDTGIDITAIDSVLKEYQPSFMRILVGDILSLRVPSFVSGTSG